MLSQATCPTSTNRRLCVNYCNSFHQRECDIGHIPFYFTVRLHRLGGFAVDDNFKNNKPEPLENDNNAEVKNGGENLNNGSKSGETLGEEKRETEL